MFTRESLYARNCSRSLVQAIEQVPARAAARLPMVLDEGSVGMLVLWTILRWERNFVLVCLEDMDVDMWALTRELDLLINNRKARIAAASPLLVVYDPLSYSLSIALDCALERWIQRAETQARTCNHPYVGSEHIVLALLEWGDPELAGLFCRHGLDHQRLAMAVAAALEKGSIPVDEYRTAAPRSQGPWGTRWDSPAAGVPRRFGMGILMLMMTMYALLFSAMQLLKTPPEVFATVAILFTGVGLGQMALYGGRYPRAASIWVGACLFPLEIIVLLCIGIDSEGGLACLLIISPVLGAFFGYLAGGLTAGVFLLLEKYGKHAEAEEPPKADT